MAYKKQTCSVCNGTGKVMFVDREWGDSEVRCSRCGGTLISYGDCSYCGFYLNENGICQSGKCGKRDPNAPLSSDGTLRKPSASGGSTPVVEKLPPEIEKIRIEAEQGDVDSQTELARIYHEGKRVTKNMVKALEWYEKAAAQGADVNFETSTLKSLIAAAKITSGSSSQTPKPSVPVAPAPKTETITVGGFMPKENKKLTYPNGDVYEGDLLGGKPHGKGKYIYTGGRLYEGDWVAGKFQGKGKLILPSGDVYEGDFDFGKFHGKGKLTSANGTVQDGNWDNGKFLGSATATSAATTAPQTIQAAQSTGKTLEDAIKLMQSGRAAEAVPILESLGERGNAQASSTVAAHYLEGLGVKKDITQAVKWLQKSAEQGSAESQLILSSWYMDGENVTKNEKLGFDWCKKAAESGHKIAQNNLGLYYLNGTGTAQSDKDAFIWFKKSADQRYEKALTSTGYCYHYGRGVSIDLAKAFEYYTKGAEKEDDNALLNIGVCYFKGQGVKRDFDKAYEYFSNAADKNNAMAMLIKLDFDKLRDEEKEKGITFNKVFNAVDKAMAINDILSSFGF